MLQAGVELNMIRSWLGHVHINTTNRYAEIDLAMKRRILETAVGMVERTKGGAGEQPRRGRWHQDQDLLRWLDGV